MARIGYKKGALEALGGFVPLPFIVLDSRAYQTLSTAAKTLLIDVARQHTGGNNGGLSPCWELMSRRGWKSKATLQNAKNEVRLSGLITVTRIGTRKKGDCELWALSWFKLDYRPDMDIQPKAHNYMGFMEIKDAKIDPIPRRRIDVLRD